MPQTLKQRLINKEPLVGTFVKTPSPIICEVLSQTKLDLICLDAEHAPFDRNSLDTCIAVTRLSKMSSLVRVPSANPEHLLNALDCGATGVLVPHVKSAHQADLIGQHCHFGAGGRGYAGSTRAANFGGKSIPAHVDDSAKETTVIAQIEDLEALDEIDEIAQVSNIDCLFVGRIDLTVALGADSPADARVVAAVDTICQSALDAGKALGMFLSDLSEIPHWMSRGASLFLLASDHSFIKSGVSTLLQKAKP